MQASHRIPIPFLSKCDRMTMSCVLASEMRREVMETILLEEKLLCNLKKNTRGNWRIHGMCGSVQVATWNSWCIVMWTMWLATINVLDKKVKLESVHDKQSLFMCRNCMWGGYCGLVKNIILTKDRSTKVRTIICIIGYQSCLRWCLIEFGVVRGEECSVKYFEVNEEIGMRIMF